MLNSNAAREEDILGSSKLVAPVEGVLSGQFCSWSNSFLERRQLAPGETPLHQLPSAVIALNLNSWNVVEHSINGKTEKTKVGPGRTSIFPAGTELKVRWERMHSVVLVGLADSLLINAAADVNERRNELILVQDINDFDVTQMILLLLRESVNETFKSTIFGDSISAALAVHLSRNYTRQGFTAIAPEGFSLREKKAIIDFLEHHFRDGISLSELSGRFNLSPYHFLRKFKTTFGSPPHRWMNDRKMKEAKKLLMERQLSVLEIAFSLGFNSSTNFSKAFKAFSKCTPSQYRNEFRD
ncbi:MAG: AraC family transcriptional regulator [Chlamydiales bacterium]|nr:AraC family transcriptional regulator [Chlamydiales bacterium]